ncbi:MAG: exopolysaccharide biosynthesis polyprenyl glycosylphosphotransferase [Bacteroidetes bacterium]|nr:exopolysaccharide biosynthesis polyprenyl glycosylphosphotransferase [Bacteroidota bacterium]
MKKNLKSPKKKIHFEISERKLLLRVFDVWVVLVSLFGIDQFIGINYFDFNKENIQWPLLLSFYLLLFNSVFELYDLQTAANIERSIKNTLFSATATTVAFLFTPYISPVLPERRLEILYFYGITLLSLLVWRILYIKLFTSERFQKKILVFGSAEEVMLIQSDFAKTHPESVVIGMSPSAKSKDGTRQYVYPVMPKALEAFITENQISEIIISNNNSKKITKDFYDVFLHLLEKGFPLREYSQVYEEVTHRIPVQHVGKDFYRYFPFSRNHQNQLYLFLHKLLDVSLALVGLFVFFLLLPLVLIGNLIANRGALFYTQIRIGKNGEPFKIYKLRTMIKNAETSGPVWAQKNDFRVTRFGRVLRRSRIDEIPQLINVLRGEMSIIGPRPERPEFVSQLSEKIPFYQTRHIICPGITGWAQVKAGYGSEEAHALEKLQYDLFYLKHRSLYLDMVILVKTFSTVLFFRGQ